MLLQRLDVTRCPGNSFLGFRNFPFESMRRATGVSGVVGFCWAGSESVDVGVGEGGEVSL